MSRKPASSAGRQLYRLLPEVYRTRDEGDLAAYLDACGCLLDKIRATLIQRLADSFPDVQEEETAQGRIFENKCQDWILPYFAQLLDVRLVSPESDGRREEVSKAVSWRKRKGTLTCIEQIAQAVAQTEVEIQEGWKRVAVSARIGVPLLLPEVFGEDREIDMSNPLEAARHPGLPAVTVDFRFPSRAVRSSPNNPAAHKSRFGATTFYWRQANPHGVPCFPGSYADVSRRTVDLRTPTWRRGHAHPKRVLLFAPPADEYFDPDSRIVIWNKRHQEKYAGLFREEERDGVWTLRGLTKKPLRIRGVINCNEEKTYRFIGVRIDHSLIVRKGRLELRDCAVRQVKIHVKNIKGPVLDAKDVLFGRVHAPRALVRLEYCTVLAKMRVEVLQASDCIFNGSLRNGRRGSALPSGCIRYSRIPMNLLKVGEAAKRQLLSQSNTAAEAIFFSTQFGKPGCGVLHPAAPAAISFGGEDGGEMGAYHKYHHVLRVQAALDKLKDYLPVGMEAVWIHDTLLRCPPPEVV